MNHQPMARLDQFAAAALTGLLSNPSNAHLSTRELALFAYQLADAMLIERPVPAESVEEPVEIRYEINDPATSRP